MPKQLTHFICQSCGAEFPKWQGQCTNCNEWNSLVETIVSTKAQGSRFPPRGWAGKAQGGEVIKLVNLSQVKDRTFKRLKTGIDELDRVLGGGIVPGSVILVAGQPGIGKSTLLTQVALELAKTKNTNKKIKKSSTIHHPPSTIIYICGEESPAQIKIRIRRLNSVQRSASSVQENLLFLPETNIENILSTIESQALKSSKSKNLELIIIDSIQTLWTQNLTGAAGSVGQVRQCSHMLLNLAKKANIPVFLIGHITKEGAIAGPKVLEHLVDTVLYLEGDKDHDFRILRAYKNRFGAVDEVGVFQMTDKGMEEVKDPSKLFIRPGLSKHVNSGSLHAGSSIVVAMQGIRPMLVEVQALVVPTQIPMPRRVASGIDYRKLQVLCAVIQKRLSLPLANSDVFVNVAGGLKLTEPAADLAICLAIISSFKNKPLIQNAACIGEVGLLGEIRKVSFMDKRIKEAKKLGFKTIIGDKETNLLQTLQFLK